METNLSDILSQGADVDDQGNVKQPKPIPAGIYLSQVMGVPRFDKSKQKQTPYVEFTHRLLEPQDDNINPDELAEALGERKLNDVTLKATYYYEEMYNRARLDQALKDMGHDLAAGESRQQMIEGSAGKTVGVVVVHEPSQDGTRMFARVNGTVADAS